jgi:hypothetical protein
MALYFPKINQIRFGAYTVNSPFYNMDNTDPDLQIYQGVYPHRFYQPMPKTWYGIVGDTNELDFLIIGTLADWATENFDCDVMQVTAFDSHSDPLTLTKIETLTPTLFYTFADGRKMYRFTKSLGSYTTGHYRIHVSIKAGQGAGTITYLSNIMNIDLPENLSECFTFSGTNFENDFGIIWINSTPTTWYLKLLIPYRMYKPVTKVEKNIYGNDSGLQTTLRTQINRVFEFETYPIPIWYGELIQMALGLSTTYLNRISVNFDAIPSLEVISESNLCVLKGNATLRDFNENYYLNL